MQFALSTGSVLDVLNSELYSDLEVISRQSECNFDIMEQNASETSSN